MTENRSAGGSIPPLGTIRQILLQLQTVISGPRDEGSRRHGLLIRRKDSFGNAGGFDHVMKRYRG